MQMLEWVLRSPLSACCKFTFVYQCNDSQMGLHGCDVNSEDSGRFTSTQLRAKTQTQQSVQSTSSKLKVRNSATPGNSERFEDGILTNNTVPARYFWTSHEQMFVGH